jgi:hypothetical protein
MRPVLVLQPSQNSAKHLEWKATYTRIKSLEIAMENLKLPAYSYDFQAYIFY